MTRPLMTHPGVGPVTALAFERVMGTPQRFHGGKQIASYLGLVPEEKSSGDRRRLGHSSQQGNVRLRFLLVEAAQSPGMAQQVLPPRHAAWPEDCQGSDGTKAGGASVLDVAPGLRLRPGAKARFVRGKARTSRWCSANHRRNDWASRSQQVREFEETNLDRGK